MVINISALFSTRKEADASQKGLEKFLNNCNKSRGCIENITVKDFLQVTNQDPAKFASLSFDGTSIHIYYTSTAIDCMEDKETKILTCFFSMPCPIDGASLRYYLLRKFNAVRVVYSHNDDDNPLYDYRSMIVAILKKESILPLLLGADQDLDELISNILKR